jgi:hypothetical protein
MNRIYEVHRHNYVDPLKEEFVLLGIINREKTQVSQE